MFGHPDQTYLVPPATGACLGQGKIDLPNQLEAEFSRRDKTKRFFHLHVYANQAMDSKNAKDQLPMESDED